MGLDIRLPIGIIFTIYGVILMIYGVVADASIFQEKSLGVNIDLWWGLRCWFLGSSWERWRSGLRGIVNHDGAPLESHSS